MAHPSRLRLPATHSNGNLNPTERAIRKNTKRTSNSNRIKNFGLAACAVMAMGVVTAGEAEAQCRFRGGNAGYRYNSGYGNNSYYGTNSNLGRNYNNRLNSGYNNGYGVYGYPDYPNQHPSLSLGLRYNGNRNSGYDSGYRNYGTSRYNNTGAYTNRSGYRNGYYSNNRQPVAYRHGDHTDVEDGHRRLHLNGRGY